MSPEPIFEARIHDPVVHASVRGGHLWLFETRRIQTKHLFMSFPQQQHCEPRIEGIDTTSGLASHSLSSILLAPVLGTGSFNRVGTKACYTRPHGPTTEIPCKIALFNFPHLPVFMIWPYPDALILESQLFLRLPLTSEDFSLGFKLFGETRRSTCCPNVSQHKQHGYKL